MKNITKIFILMFASLQIACSAEIMNKDATSADKAETYTLVRDWKKVIRYDCAGDVTSDEVETVRSPIKYVAVAPKTSKNLYNSQFKNLTNDSRTKLIVGGYTFYVDMAPSLLNLKVEEGLNQIEYSFSYCDERKKDEKGESTAQCVHDPRVEETGSLYIKVVYQQNWLEGQDEVKPTTEECKRLEEEKGKEQPKKEETAQ